MKMEPESRKPYLTHILSTQFLCIMREWEGLGKGMGHGGMSPWWQTPWSSKDQWLLTIFSEEAESWMAGKEHTPSNPELCVSLSACCDQWIPISVFCGFCFVLLSYSLTPQWWGPGEGWSIQSFRSSPKLYVQTLENLLFLFFFFLVTTISLYFSPLHRT
jgi:hypothetical protein